MDWRDFPPLSALKAFAAYVDTASVSAAGDKLNVSHAAISQQLRSLEAHLGLRLFDRSGRRMVLTAEGAALARAVTDGFEQIGDAVRALKATEDERPLYITATPSLAANWLMPRLPRFRDRYPDLSIVIDPTPTLQDPRPGAVDLAIRYGNGDWSGLVSEMFLPSPVVVVGAPELVGAITQATPSELSHFPWLQELGTTEATEWLGKSSIPSAPMAGLTSVPGNLMLDGARSGQGLAVTARVAVEDDIRAGRLRVLYEEPDPKGYHLVTAPGVPRPALKNLLVWLRREAKRDAI